MPSSSSLAWVDTLLSKKGLKMTILFCERFGDFCFQQRLSFVVIVTFGNKCIVKLNKNNYIICVCILKHGTIIPFI